LWTTGKGGQSTLPFSLTVLQWSRLRASSFLGVHITNKLTWSKHTKTVVKRAKQSLFLLKRLKIFSMYPQILKSFFSCTIESILTDFITA
jgi:hypothetical protein